MQSIPYSTESVSDNQVNVYFRTSDKRGFSILVPKTSSLNELTRILYQRLRITDSYTILFYRGQKITQDWPINLEEKGIIHIVNTKQVNKQYIQVLIKQLEGGNTQRYVIPSSLVIGQFIRNQLNQTFGWNQNEGTLFYLGKPLNIKNKFSDELVEDKSQLIFISSTKNLISQFNKKTQYKSSEQSPDMGNANCNSKSVTLENPDPLFDLIMQDDLKKNSWPSIIDTYKQNQEHQSLMAKNINKELFEKLKNHKTKNGWTIARAINTGTLYPDSFIGCHAGDLQSYHDFKEFFYPVIEGCHFGFKMDGSMKHTTDIDSSKIQVKLEQKTISKVISTRIRCARNLKMFPLNTVGTKQSRNDVLDLIKKVVAQLPVDLQGDLYPLEGMTEQKRKQLINLHFLFRGADKMQAASGYHAFWPSGRGIFLSYDRKFIMWINEGDHLRIISMENGGNIQSVFDRFSRAVNAIQANIKKITGSEEVFLHDPVIGMIACCPSNLGTCLRGSVHILLPKLIKKIGFKEIDKIGRTMGCQARGSTGEHSEVIDRIDISNWRRLGFPEYKLVEDMMKCANELAKMQDEA